MRFAAIPIFIIILIIVCVCVRVRVSVCVRRLPVALVAGLAEAEEGSVGVAAVRARVAAAVVGDALVHVLALGAVAAPAVAAAALVRSLTQDNISHYPAALLIWCWISSFYF